MDKNKIILLDLNYTLVSNQQATRLLRPFSLRMEKEEYRKDLLDAIRNNDVVIVTARPEYQKQNTIDNIFRKMNWYPAESYFNDINAEPPVFKESALRRFIFSKHGSAGSRYLAIESNPRTRAMYARYGIKAVPYETFIKDYKKPKIEETSLF